MIQPEGVISPKPWHIILICDCSDTMQEKGKIDEVNKNIHDLILTFNNEQEHFPGAILLGVVTYSSGATWHIPFGTPIENVRWADLSPGGMSDLGAGIILAAQALQEAKLSQRVYSPLILIISSSSPTDSVHDGLKKLQETQQGLTAIRYAIAIGRNAPVKILEDFISDKDTQYFAVRNPAQLLEAMNQIIHRARIEQAESKALLQENLASRNLHFYWIIDCSGSMNADGKIQQLNNAIKEALPAMRDEAEKNINANVFMRTLKFSNGAQWIDPQPVPLEDFTWSDLTAIGKRDLGAAFDLLAQELQRIRTSRMIPPVLVLATDGSPTDNYWDGLNKLRKQPLAIKAVRLAIAIGSDADRNVLKEFVGSTGAILEANSPQSLVQYIRWASVDIPEKTKIQKGLPPAPSQTKSGSSDPKKKIMEIFSDLPLKDLSKDPYFFITLLGMECAHEPAVFDRLFALLKDYDPKIRSVASDVLSEHPDSLKKIIEIYKDHIVRDPGKAVLAGRVLGRKSVKMVSQEHPMIHADNTRFIFGESIAFAPCVCGHCGSVNDGIPVPEKGLYIGYYGQKNTDRGSYFLPVLCDSCGLTFFMAWDEDPRT